MIPYQPLGTRVLIEKLIATEEKTASGIIIAESATAKYKKAKVVKVGPEVNTLKEGDIVSYSIEPTRTISLDQKEYHLMYEVEIDGIFMHEK